MVGVGDMVQRTGDDRTGRVLGGQVIERSVTCVEVTIVSKFHPF
jgi:hypothetical protein